MSRAEARLVAPKGCPTVPSNFMQNIQAVLLEPVGCLADFPAAPFHEIAAQVFGRRGKASASASREYWHLLNLMHEAGELDAGQSRIAVALETEAAAEAKLYEDVRPMLEELGSMGVAVLLATSMSRAAAMHFLERNGIETFFTDVATRDDAGGVKAVPLKAALHGAGIGPEASIFLTDTVEGIKTARAAGVHAILMMNDPDEAQRLAGHEPDGGVVSLHEIPDFVRLVAAQNLKLHA